MRTLLLSARIGCQRTQCAQSHPWARDDLTRWPRIIKEVAYRFIVYLPVLDSVYELDGLRVYMRAARVGLLEHGIPSPVSCAFLKSPKYS